MFNFQQWLSWGGAYVRKGLLVGKGFSSVSWFLSSPYPSVCWRAVSCWKGGGGGWMRAVFVESGCPAEAISRCLSGRGWPMGLLCAEWNSWMWPMTRSQTCLLSAEWPLVYCWAFLRVRLWSAHFQLWLSFPAATPWLCRSPTLIPLTKSTIRAVLTSSTGSSAQGTGKWQCKTQWCSLHNDNIDQFPLSFSFANFIQSKLASLGGCIEDCVGVCLCLLICSSENPQLS